ncbi:MAG: hypothetical protein LBI42_13300 [Chitinispirillales bacterium]|jgi:hypothetical protein|nr:hypothetical protein [Chitinispirillales bacterium]
MKNLLKKIFKRCLIRIINKTYTIYPPPQISYLAQCFGVKDIDLNFKRSREFYKNGGDYLLNFIFPKSWQEKIGYYVHNYYNYSPKLIAIRHKWLAKKWTERWIGEQYVVPTYGVWDTTADIEWDKLPKSFVLKACMGYRGEQVIVVYDKYAVNKTNILRTMQKHIDKSPTFTKKKIIAEMLLLDSNGLICPQYQFYCGQGKPLCCRVDFRLHTDVNAKFANMVFYDIPNWQKLLIQYGKKPSHREVPCPKNLDEMIKVASELSSHFPISRIDLYNVNEHIYVGEITLAPGSAVHSPITPSEYDFRLGEGVGNVIPVHELDKIILKDKGEFSLDEIGWSKHYDYKSRLIKEVT